MTQALTGDAGVRVWVPGRPRTKGSLKPLHVRLGGGRCRVSLTESGKYAIAWKERVISHVRVACECQRWPGPVTVHTFFRFERLTAAEQQDVGYSPQPWPWPTREAGEYAHGDEDKLRRNVLDALTQSGLILDDSLVIGGETYKRYCEAGEEPGVLIYVMPVNGSADKQEFIKTQERAWSRVVTFAQDVPL